MQPAFRNLNEDPGAFLGSISDATPEDHRRAATLVARQTRYTPSQRRELLDILGLLGTAEDMRKGDAA